MYPLEAVRSVQGVVFENGLYHMHEPLGWLVVVGWVVFFLGLGHV